MDPTENKQYNYLRPKVLTDLHISGQCPISSILVRCYAGPLGMMCLNPYDIELKEKIESQLLKIYTTLTVFKKCISYQAFDDPHSWMGYIRD